VNVALNMLEAITGPDSLCLGKAAAVPLKVEGFTAVATFQLRLSYNFDKLICTGWTNSHPALGTAMTGSVLPDGEILLQWQSTVPVTILAQATICDLVFTTREPGQGQLDWYTNATESFFTGIAGQPIPAEFYAGQVVIYEPPVIEMPETLYACVGQPLIIPGDVEGINPPFSYQWIYPIGLTDSIQPYFSSVTLADAGVYTLLVTDAMGCTDRKTTRLEVSENPVAAFHGIDTMQVVYGYVLDAGGGMISYLWNTGETTQSIETKTEGWYIVELMSEAGCIGIDSVYILWLQVCIDVPNAFTPNSDGLNDIFLAESVCPISYFRMIIYNRWGEKLFESHDITVGWDGTLNGVPCPGDTYVYVVSYIVGESPGSEVKGEKAGMLLLLK
jgi:gliding motility-associated-like protein